MAAILVELPDDLHRWVLDRAAEYQFSTAQMLEHLVILESWLRNEDPLGRHIPMRDFTYRQLTPPLQAPAGDTGAR